MDNLTDDQVVIDDNEDSFIQDGEAIEVKVDDDDIPMEIEGDEDEEEKNASHANAEEVPDMSIQKIECHNSSPVYAIASHHDKMTNCLSIITGGGDDKAYLHKLDNNNSVKTIPLSHPHSDSISSVASNETFVSGDLKKTPKYLAVGAYDGTVVLYNPDDGEKLKVLDGPTDVEFVSFHPKGGSVLLAGSISDGTVWMYHLPTSKCLQVFVGHECNDEGGGVTSGSFTPDGKFALTVGMDGTMRIWAPRTGMCKHVFKLYEEGDMMARPGLICLAVDGGADGQLTIAGGEDGNGHVIHLQSKKVVAKLHHFDSVAAANDRGEEIMITSVEAVGFASKLVNSNWVATGGSDGTLKIWDLTHNGGQCRQTCVMKGESDSSSSSGGITRIFWHPTQPLLFASYTDGAVRLWDARNGSLLHTLTGGKHDNQINDISVEIFGTEQGPGTAIVSTANDDGSVNVFNVDISAVLNQ